MSKGPAFDVGDVVRLNSSADRMTVSVVKEGGRIEARWFDETGDLLGDEFDPREITLIKKGTAA